MVLQLQQKDQDVNLRGEMGDVTDMMIDLYPPTG